MKNTNAFSVAVLSFVAMLIFTNCEKNITADLPDPVEKVVVEGSIESGGTPLVMLNRNYPYFGEFNPAQYGQGFERDAIVKVSDGTNTVTLQEICFSELTDEQKEIFAGQMSGLPDSLPAGFDFCVYTLLVPSMIGQFGKTYTLDITTTDNKHLTAVTTIPNAVPLDSVWIEPSPNPDYADSLRRLWVQFKDPDTLGNYYKFWTGRNSEPLYPVQAFDDLVVNGKLFYFPMNRGETNGADFDINTFGYYTLGDTARLKWVTIDNATYNFWNSLEFSEGSTGPFGSVVKVKYNIDGGIGIWAGYGISTEQSVVINN